MTNVLGDSMAAGIIQNYYSKLLISGTSDQVKRASVLITGQVDDSFKKDSEKLMSRRVSTMAPQDQKAIEAATGLSVTDSYGLTPSTQPEALDLQDPPSPEIDERRVSNPAHDGANPASPTPCTMGLAGRRRSEQDRSGTFAIISQLSCHCNPTPSDGTRLCRSWG